MWINLSVCSLNLKRYQIFKTKTTHVALYIVTAYLSIQGRYCGTELYLTLHCRTEEKTPSTKIWNRNECTPASNRTGSNSDSGTTQKFENRSNNWKTVQQQKMPDSSNASQHIRTPETSQTHSTKGQRPVKPNTTSRNLQDSGLAYKFNSNSQQNSMNEKQFDCVPEDKSQVNLWSHDRKIQ